MQCTVLLFAQLAEALDTRQLTIELPDRGHWEKPGEYIERARKTLEGVAPARLKQERAVHPIHYNRAQPRTFAWLLLSQVAACSWSWNSIAKVSGVSPGTVQKSAAALARFLDLPLRSKAL